MESHNAETQEYIKALDLKDDAVLRRSAHIEQERQVALGDLLRSNYFAPMEHGDSGPYHVTLEIQDNRLVFTILGEASDHAAHIVKIPVSAFRRIIKDYFLICESYFEAIKDSDPYKVEAIDMGRRGIHNEGSEMLKKLLADKVEIDFDTARRLFTLMCVLHIR